MAEKKLNKIKNDQLVRYYILNPGCNLYEIMTAQISILYSIYIMYNIEVCASFYIFLLFTNTINNIYSIGSLLI